MEDLILMVLEPFLELSGELVLDLLGLTLEVWDWDQRPCQLFPGDNEQQDWRPITTSGINSSHIDTAPNLVLIDGDLRFFDVLVGLIPLFRFIFLMLLLPFRNSSTQKWTLGRVLSRPHGTLDSDNTS